MVETLEYNRNTTNFIPYTPPPISSCCIWYFNIIVLPKRGEEGERAEGTLEIEGQNEGAREVEEERVSNEFENIFINSK